MSNGHDFLHHHLGTCSVVIPLFILRHDQVQREAQRIRRTDIFIDTLHRHIDGEPPRRNGHRAGEQPEMTPLHGVALAVDDLHADLAVVIRRSGSGYPDVEYLVALLHPVPVHGVGEHEVIGTRIGEISGLAADGQRCHRNHDRIFHESYTHRIHIPNVYLLLSLGSISEPGASSSCCGIGHTNSGSSASTFRLLPLESDCSCGSRSKPLCQRLRSCRRKPSM